MQALMTYTWGSEHVPPKVHLTFNPKTLHLDFRNSQNSIT